MSPLSRRWPLLLLVSAVAAYISPTPEPPGAVLYDRSWPYPASGGDSWPPNPWGRRLWRRAAGAGAAPRPAYRGAVGQPHWMPPQFLQGADAERGLQRVLSRQRRKHGRPQRWNIARLCEERGECTCYSQKTRATYCCDCEWGSCFPGQAGVALEGGQLRRMDRLAAGDRVLTVTSGGELTPTTVLGFLDRRPQATGEYLHLQLASGHQLRLSANHVTFTRSGGGVYASQVQPGDELLVAAANSTSYSPVVSVQYSIMKGAFVPLTEHGTLLVDGVWASNYASFPHALSHALTTPFRLWPALLSERFVVADKNVLVDGLKRLGRLTLGAYSGGVLRLVSP
ncbi:desert hedgehog protein B-like [Pollicipes pollicipes]|uniref:desert hedgehog protein B-like n=1 Tax=Pollicipes pollicipes TaxID=41117 RepID=UPI0018853888|nr:desert hedgehog protein B-like [Pollicipes pollicipes]